MHMWHHVTNHLIISNDKDSNSENRIKLRVRDKNYTTYGKTVLVAKNATGHHRIRQGMRRVPAA
jgi:hypothetical protein